MGTFDVYADRPDQIKLEGQEITITFQKISDTTARITWNIPAPSAGCNSLTQAYNGIVITIANSPANYISTSPKDGVYYNADSTADPDLHAGDKLDGALVIGAFYDDKITTYIDITDIKEKTPYYVSGYAVDKVARYHTAGVHAYSLPSGPQEPNNSKDLPAIQDIGIDWNTPITPSTLTGLVQGTTYTATFLINGKKYTITLDGVLGLDYDDLIYAINQEFIRLTEPKYLGPYPPHTNDYYVDLDNTKIYQWNGYMNIDKDGLFQNNDPTSPINGLFWYKPSTKNLSEYNAGWVDQTYITSVFDFTQPKCYQFWFNGTTVYKWEKVLWCELPTYISTTNPLINTGLDCNTFWYDIVNHDLYQWDDQIKKWNITQAIYYDLDPNNIVSGNYWYNQTDSKVYYRLGNGWTLLNNIQYVEPDTNGDYPYPPAANHYWFIPSQQKLFRRNTTNTTWVLLDVILYVSDPTDRGSCQLWWNSSVGVDSLFIWDTVNSVWKAVSHFYQQSADPNTPIDIPLNSAWYNPDTEILTIINNPDCTTVLYVYSLTDPTVVVLNQIWFDDLHNKWYQWNGSGWQEIFPFIDELDPFSVTVGELWFNTASNILSLWNGTMWVQQNYSLSPLNPTIGDLWYNEIDTNLYEWNGTTWIITTGIAYATLIYTTRVQCDGCRGTFGYYWNLTDGIPFPLSYPKDLIRISTKERGCVNHIELCFESTPANTTNKQLFGSLKQSVIYFPPIPGQSAQQSGPMYLQLGVGTDGSPDERRALHTTIRISLGDPSQKVELTKEQLDRCIDNALLMFRKRSSYSYTRNLFFLDVKPNQQLYILNNQCVGFNKIVDINAIYRMRAGFLGSLYGSNGVFGYAALQQLYTLGTFDTLSFHLVASYIEDLQTLFADNIMFQWVESKRELKTYKSFYQFERVLIDCVMERTEQDLLTNRDTAIWLQQWAITEAKAMLAQIRGKFQTLPGPNGSTVLNSQELLSQVETEKAALLADLEDMVYQDILDVGLRAHMIIG